MESPTGRPEARYDFSISRMLSGYHVSHAGASGVVAMRGSFWADPETYDLHRLEFHAEEIPPELLYSDISTAIYYDRVHIGESDVLLPQAADLRTTDADGEENRDLIEFTHCQGFRTESTLHFDAADGAPAAAVSGAPAQPPAEGTLPRDLRVAVALSAPLDDHAPVGSLIEGLVAGGVMQKGKLLVPAGALVRGRIRRLERRSGADYFVVALEFTRIETPAANVRFYADLQDLDHREGIDLAFSAIHSPTRVQIWTSTLPGVGTFVVRGPHFSLPRGFKTFWKTQLYPPSANR